mgnify:CR=1 FL=1
MEKSAYKNMWVYIEHDKKTVAPVSLELCCEARKLCDVTGEKLVAVILGELPEEEVAKIRGCAVDEIILVNGTGLESYSVDAYTHVFTQLCQKYMPSAVFVGGTTNGRDFAPRFAVQLNTGCTSDATEVVYNPESKDIEFIEPAVGEAAQNDQMIHLLNDAIEAVSMEKIQSVIDANDAIKAAELVRELFCAMGR